MKKILLLLIIVIILGGCNSKQQNTQNNDPLNLFNDKIPIVTESGTNDDPLNISNNKNEKLPTVGQEDTILGFVEDISLNSSVELIKEKLGAPHKIFKEKNKKYLVYHFDELSLKVGTEDNETIDSLTYLLNDKNKQIAIIPAQNNPNLILGKNTFGDYSFYCPKITSAIGAKDVVFYCDCYFGNPGKYWEYRIGIYNDNIPLPSDYQKDENGLTNNEYLQNIKMNFVSIARDGEDLTSFYYEDFR